MKITERMIQDYELVEAVKALPESVRRQVAAKRAELLAVSVSITQLEADLAALKHKQSVLREECGALPHARTTKSQRANHRKVSASQRR